jgi:hypothetical protein
VVEVILVVALAKQLGNITDWNATLNQNPENLSPAEREQLNQLRNTIAQFFGRGSNNNGINLQGTKLFGQCNNQDDLNHPLFGQAQASNNDDIKVDDINKLLGFTFVMMIALLVICILYVVIASLLIHGARKGKAGLLIPWIVLTAITFIFDCVQLIFTIINYICNPFYLGIVCGLIGCHMGIASYLLVIVWSFRQQLRQGDASASNEMRKM